LQRWTDADGLPSNSIRSLYEDNDGVLWIGTYDGGLGRLQNGLFTRYTVRDGLFNNGVFQILEDARGYLWMSSNRGIYQVLKKELNEFAQGRRQSISSTNYDTQDGMLNSECNGGYAPAGVKTLDNRLWFPTQQGIAIIDPSAVEVNLQAPPVVIESLLVDHQARSLSEPIRILPGQESLEIAYTAPSLIDSDRIQFKYMLEGLDQKWVNASTRRIAYYSHLPHGQYEFHVLAANSDGVWNTTGAKLHISVLPRFYQTRWFIVACSLVILASSYQILHSRLSQLEKKRILQQEISSQLILSQESERKRIAGELHDSLGQHLLVIKNWASLALQEVADAANDKEPLMQISETASQAIDEVREIAYNLRPFQLEKLGLSTAIRDLVDQVACSSDIHFSVSVDPLEGAFPRESEISVYRMVQESLNNIVRHSQAKRAGVALRREEKSVKITIWDDGQGFRVPERLDPQIGRAGFGLLGISERVRTLGGQETIESSPGSGTVIHITLRSE
jgi:signal transduction histidine kinase